MPGSGERPNAVAVVIGNKNYKNPNVPSVDYAVRDAAVVKEYLVKTLGFEERNILYYTNADNADFRNIFGDNNEYRGELYDAVKKGGDVFIFIPATVRRM